MLIELKGATVLIQAGKACIMAHEPKECCKCHRMAYFFESVRGETRCLTCPSDLPTRQ